MLRFAFKIALVLSLIATPGVVFADEIISSDHDWSLRQTDAGAPFLFTAQNGGNFSVAPSKSNSSLLVMIIERQKLRNSARLVVGRYSMTLIPKPLPEGRTLLIGDVYPDNLRAFFDSLRESKALYVLSPEIKRTLSLQGADKEVIQFSMFSEKYLTQKAEQSH